MSPVGCHGISRGNSTQRYRMLIGAFISHYTDTADGREKDDTSLPDLIVERNLDVSVLHIGRYTSSQDFASLFTTKFYLILSKSSDIDIIRILQNTNLIWGDVAQDADGKTRTWEGVAGNEMLGHSQLTTHTAHLILEQPFQRFTELQVHLFRQSAHIVMTLDYLTCNIQ